MLCSKKARYFYLLVASKGDGIHIQSSISLILGLASVYIHYLVSYMLMSSLQVATFIQWSLCQAYPAYSWYAKHCATF